MCGRYTFFTDREIGDIEEIIDQIDKDVNREKLKTGGDIPLRNGAGPVRGRGNGQTPSFRMGIPGISGQPADHQRQSGDRAGKANVSAITFGEALRGSLHGILRMG